MTKHSPSHCTDPKCTSTHHDHGFDIEKRRRELAMPISESDARIIDEARRALIARATHTTMLPPTPDLEMFTRQIDLPHGIYEVEIHYVLVAFTDNLPVHRARVQTVLRSHFNRSVRLENDGPTAWRYTINAPYRMTFDVLADIHAAIYAIASNKVAQSRIQGLYASGIFISEQSEAEEPVFRVCGDAKP